MKAIVLAAGRGTRLCTEKDHLPKVLRSINKRPIISYVLDNISFLSPGDIYIVVGYKKEMVIKEIGERYNYAVQQQQLGTGHAVKAAEGYFKGYGQNVLVLYGDMPLFASGTYKNLIDIHQKENCKCTLLTAVVENPPDYGRIIRDSSRKITGIIEKRDCSPGQLEIKEINVGMYVFDSRLLFTSLEKIKNDNSQQEYYITDLPKILIREGHKVCSHTITDKTQVYGVNNPEELKLCEKILKDRERLS